MNRLLLILLISVAATGCGLVQASEFQISEYEKNAQWVTHLKSNASGRTVVVWQSHYQDQSGWGIYARILSPYGNPIGSEFRVNEYTPGNQFVGRVALDAEGGFVIVWESLGQDGDGFGVFARLFDQAGSPRGPEFRVNQESAGGQHNPMVGMKPNGEFLVAWISEQQDGSEEGVFARRFDKNGRALGDEFLVNTQITGSQTEPYVSVHKTGISVVTWKQNPGNRVNTTLYGQLLDDKGAKLGAEFRINSPETFDVSGCVVKHFGDGGFVVAWHGTIQKSHGRDVFAQIYSPTAKPLTEVFRINSVTEGEQEQPAVSVAADSFLVVFENTGKGASGSEVVAQRFDREGRRIGNQFQLNSYTENDQFGPFVAPAGDGHHFASWTSVKQDGSAEGVFGRRVKR